MTDKRLLTPEEVIDVLNGIPYGSRHPEHCSKRLLAHIQAQAERIEELEAVIAQKEARRTTPTVNPYDLDAIGLDRARRRGRGDER